MIYQFAHPAFLLLLLCVPAYIWLMRLRREPVMRYSDTRLLEGLTTSWRVRLRRLPDVLRVLAWCALVVAVSRPQTGQAREIIRGQGIDMVLALDISSSMAALDFDPQSRLDAAKSVISNFVSGREFDHIGLVVFARDAFHQSPPTLDYNILLRLLDEVQLATDIGLEDGTAIGLGLASAANMLRASQAPTRIIILLTDGANNSGAVAPITAAEALSTLGLRVYTIGMGRSGLVSIPVDNSGQTQTVESDLDEATLQEIANLTDGRYFRAVDLSDLQQIYDQIDVLEQSDVERQVFVRWQEQGDLWLALGLALLIGERVLRQTVFQVIP